MSHPDKPLVPTKVQLEHTYKGCIHWFKFTSNPQASTINDIHPCIIIGKDNPNSRRVIISPISDADNYLKPDGSLRFPYHVLLKKSDYQFLDKDSVVLLDQVFTVPRSDFCEEWYIDNISDTRKIDEAIMSNYDLIDTVYALLHEMIDEMAQHRRAI